MKSKEQKTYKKIKSGFLKLRKKIWQKKSFRRAIFGFSFFILGLAILFFSFNLAYQNKILPRTFIGQTNFGGKTRFEAKEILDKSIESSQGKELNFSYEGKSYSLKVEKLGLDYAAKEELTLDLLMAVGRGGGLGKVIKEQIFSIMRRNPVLAAFDFQDDKLNQYLDGIAQEIDIAEKDATLVIKSGQPEVVQERVGRRFEIYKNRQIVLNHLGSFSFPGQLPLQITQILPKITSSIAASAIPETLELLQHHLVLRASNDKTFEIGTNEIAEMIEFVPRINNQSPSKNKTRETSSPYVLSPKISRAKVKTLVEKIATEVYQEPKDPKFQVSGSRVVAFQLGQTGYELDEEKTTEQIIEALKSGQSDLELPIKVTEPTISSDNPATIGLKELVGEGTTNFSGSPQNRRHNITVGAQSFDGVLIKPGEEFSMLKYLGPVEASTGYLPELVIKEDRTIPEYGGGLCQVSTTMFRAALNTGLKITERQNHSYRVRYYEPPVGMDATIYIPKPDLKFVNDFESHLLIQTSVSGDNLTFRFYGTKDGRRSETTDPYIYDVISAGEPIYTESPDLAPGEIKQIETAHPGSKASFTYKVYDRIDKLINEQTFQSSYVPWPARYMYGPGTTIPPAE